MKSKNNSFNVLTKTLNLLKEELKEKEEPSKAESFKYICPKHGDVTTKIMTITFENPEDYEKPFVYMYCLEDLNELLLELQKEGKLNIIRQE